MTPSLGIEPRPHWWEVSALTTAHVHLDVVKVVLRPKKQLFFFFGFQNYVYLTLTDPSFKF